MKKIYGSVSELIGHTPLLEVKNIAEQSQLQAKIVVKLEYFNPAGSVKDRVAAAMIREAEKAGILRPGATVIEATSGNTGIGLAAVAAAKGYPTIFVMSESMSIERRKILQGYGARIELTPAAEGTAGAVKRAKQMLEEIPGSFMPGQFENPVNPATHYATTGPEIWEDTDGTVAAFVAGVGTGGTVSGVGRYLKEQNRDVHIVAIEPAGSPVISTGKSGSHNIQGIGAGFIPATLDREVCDEVMTVTDDDALASAKRLAKEEGLLVGISSGAALWGALQLAARPVFAGKTIVALLPDTGERYLSTALFDFE